MDAIGQLPDDLVERTDALRQKKPVTWYRWAALAACLCVVLSLSGLLVLPWTFMAFQKAGSAAPENEAADQMAPLELMYADATVVAVDTDLLTVRLENGALRLIEFDDLAQEPVLEPGMQVRVYYYGTKEYEDGTLVLITERIEVKEETR
jgi:hypothetical protein